jgi:hypothetical protein
MDQLSLVAGVRDLRLSRRRRDFIRLLNVHTLTVEKHFVGRIPPYLILSHTWGDDEDEISLKDMRDIDETYKSRRAWRTKVRGFCKAAKKAKVNYVWVDTCCIKKTDDTESQSSIKRMYAFYQQAKACYVHLEDITNDEEGEILSWIRKARWFRRGWTLQELVAPKHLKFFDRNWHLLGNRKELAGTLYARTGIPIRVLRGTQDPRSCDANKRLKWCKGRSTKKPEDRAYSMLGLLDVDMPLYYGEGKKKAFQRLRYEVKLKEDMESEDYLDSSDTDSYVSRVAQQMKEDKQSKDRKEAKPENHKRLKRRESLYMISDSE